MLARPTRCCYLRCRTSVSFQQLRIALLSTRYRRGGLCVAHSPSDSPTSPFPAFAGLKSVAADSTEDRLHTTSASSGTPPAPLPASPANVLDARETDGTGQVYPLTRLSGSGHAKHSAWENHSVATVFDDSFHTRRSQIRTQNTCSEWPRQRETSRETLTSRTAGSTTRACTGSLAATWE